jgi:hypothetical protein
VAAIVAAGSNNNVTRIIIDGILLREIDATITACHHHPLWEEEEEEKPPIGILRRLPMPRLAIIIILPCNPDSIPIPVLILIRNDPGTMKMLQRP